MNRLVKRIKCARAENRMFLVGYLPSGYPGPAEFPKFVQLAFQAGVDAMEFSLPDLSGPHEGPVIRRAARIGARNIMDPRAAIRSAASARVCESQPLVALVHRHSFDALGGDYLVSLCKRYGIDAVLLPEHSAAEQLEFASQIRSAGLEQVIFISAEQDFTRLAETNLPDPVIYLRSGELRTGGHFGPREAQRRVCELRRCLNRKKATVMVGFGVRGPAEIAMLAAARVDGVVVGTALVEAAAKGMEEFVECIAKSSAPLHQCTLDEGRNHF